MKKRNGFTLVELLAVMGIMVLLMGISTMGFIGIRRGAELRGGTRTIRSSLMLARQLAVTKRQTVTVFFSTNSMIVSSVALNTTNRTTYFSPGISITPPGNNPLQFLPSGGLAVAGSFTDQIVITDKLNTASKKTITVWLLTGATKEED